MKEMNIELGLGKRVKCWTTSKLRLVLMALLLSAGVSYAGFVTGAYDKLLNMVECPYCAGGGEVTCMGCMGNGTMQTSRMDAWGNFWPVTVKCELCDGYGSVDCMVCSGSGLVEKSASQTEGGNNTGAYSGGFSGSFSDDYVDHSCRACNNTGTCPGCYGHGENYGTGKCNVCHGTGKCPNCGGKGSH